MKTLQKSGGFAALYMAISHLIGFRYLYRRIGFSASPTRLKRCPEHLKNRRSSFRPTCSCTCSLALR